jgi:hypothetical protein
VRKKEGFGIGGGHHGVNPFCSECASVTPVQPQALHGIQRAKQRLPKDRGRRHDFPRTTTIINRLLSPSRLRLNREVTHAHSRQLRAQPTQMEKGDSNAREASLRADQRDSPSNQSETKTARPPPLLLLPSPRPSATRAQKEPRAGPPLTRAARKPPSRAPTQNRAG